MPGKTPAVNGVAVYLYMCIYVDIVIDKKFVLYVVVIKQDSET